jgi:hypothetical protein
MPSALDRRVRQLEHAGGRARQRVLVWRGLDQMNEEAIASRFPDGVPADVAPVVIGWMTPEIAAARGME